MKKIIYFLPFFLVVGLFLGTAKAQSGTQIHRSNIQSREIQNRSSNIIKAYPNPCTGQFVVRFYSPSGGRTGITVFDFHGNGMIAIEMIATSGVNSVPVDITGYGVGTYSVMVSGKDVFGTTQVVVK